MPLSLVGIPFEAWAMFTFVLLLPRVDRALALHRYQSKKLYKISVLKRGRDRGE